MIGRNIALLRWHNFFLDFRLYGPIAIIYFAQITGSYALGLAVFSLGSIASTLFEVPTGILSDRIGRKKTIILGSLASFFALSFYAAANSFILLAVGAVLEGAASSFFSGNNDALLYDTLNQQKKKKTFSDALGKLSAMFQAGLGISALIGGFIAGYSLKWVMIASIIPQFICVLISFWFIEPKIHTEKISENIFTHLKESGKAFKKNLMLRKLSLTYILDYGIEETNHQFKPVFIQLLWPTWALGVARSLDHLFAFLGFHFAGKIIKKFKALKTLFFQQIISRVISLTFIGFPSIISPVMLSINSFFFGAGVTANKTLFHDEFTDKQRATMSSLNALFGNLFFAVFAFVMGMIADNIGPIKALLIGEFLLIIVVLMYWNLYKKNKKD
ncbi:MFS transporter [Candidatus Woesearchaeota archaeon]|nr:MFS transporter [Candidatus Woesearchaeota archaeon]